MKILICLLLCFFLVACGTPQAQAPEPTVPPTEPAVEVFSQETTVGVGYGSTYCYDPSLPEGKMEVLFEGQTGLAQQVSNLTYTNDVLTGREVLSQEITKAPVNQIVAIGTGEKEGSIRTFPLIGENLLVTAQGEVFTFSHVGRFSATAYTAGEPGVDHTTATGTRARVGAIAVDPKVIPYFTKMFIVTEDGKYVYGYASAEDCGGGIKGNRIDLYFDTLSQCNTFGVRMCQVYFLN